MSALVAGLTLYPTFQELPAGALQASAPWWSARSLAPGEVIWRQGEPSDGLAIVLRGEVAARLDDLDLGRVGHGGLIGEVSAFVPGATRTATVTAVGPVDLAVLPRAGLVALRDDASPVYEALLAQALRAISRRLRTSNLRVAALATGTTALPSRDPPGTLARMWRRFVPGLPKGACPPIAPLLRAQPGLAHTTEANLEALGRGFTAEALPEGHVLCLESEEADCAWVIAEGKVDVLRTVEGNRAERLASLGPGDLLGAGALVERTTRTASCVTAAPTWAWRISLTDLGRLDGPAAVTWKEMVIGALSTQLRLAQQALARVGAQGQASAPDTLDPLVTARGYLDGLPLEAVRRMAGDR